MSKDKATDILDIRKDFLKQCFTDATLKIAKAKKRIKELELARELFRKNALEGAEMPGELSEGIAQLDSQKSDQQHSV